MHVAVGDELPVLLAVGSEGYAAVEEDFEHGPQLAEVSLASDFEGAAQHGHHPGGYAREAGDGAVLDAVGDALHLLLEVAEQGYLLAGHTHEVDQGVDVFDEDSAEVAHEAVAQVVVGGMAAAKDERLAFEEAALRMVAQVECYGVGATAVVEVVEPFARYGDKLALVVGGAR